MPAVLGIDVGTTTITCSAISTERGQVLAQATLANDAEVTSPTDKVLGRSEWDADRMLRRTIECLREVTGQLGSRCADLVAVGVTGQQHGVVMIDGQRRPLTALINWQDRRGEELSADLEQTWTQQARNRVGHEASHRTGCRLSSGYMATTLYWLHAHARLPAKGMACFIMDFIASWLTGERPVTEPSSAASSGVFDASRRTWDEPSIRALGLPPSMFPQVREADHCFGRITSLAAQTTGLPKNLPVAIAIGDNQASFIGSVANRDESILVNVGTGGQVTVFTDRFLYAPALETRPFPLGGYLLVSAGLCGGQSYAVLERFFRAVGQRVFGQSASEELYGTLHELAACTPKGADGLRCEPLFTGTRCDPTRRATWSGMSPQNLTPGHLVRSLLEGMARVFQESYAAIQEVNDLPRRLLIGAGNGLRKNQVLAQCMADQFALPIRFPVHREEAAVGAALLAGVACGAFADLSAAGKVLSYESDQSSARAPRLARHM